MALDEQVSQSITKGQLRGITDHSARQNLLPLTNGLGYSTGAGGAVTQLTNRSTGVTLSKFSGTITTDTTSLAALAIATFTVTNTLVAIGDVILVSKRSGFTNTKTDVRVTAVAAGSFDISIHNIDASTAEIGAGIINFIVLKAVSA